MSIMTIHAYHNSDGQDFDHVDIAAGGRRFACLREENLAVGGAERAAV